MLVTSEDAGLAIDADEIAVKRGLLLIVRAWQARFLQAHSKHPTRADWERFVVDHIGVSVYVAQDSYIPPISRRP